MITSFIAKTCTTLLALVAGCRAGVVYRDVYGERTWHKYVRSPSTSIVKPKSILAANITGNVSNPNGFLEGNDAPTILSRKPDDLHVPSIVVDFGQNVVGIVSIDFAQSTNSSQGLPGLKLAFSETQQFLTNTSDFTRSDNLPEGQKITKGTDQVAVPNDPSTWKNKAGCQYGNKVCSDGLHGFRYMKIWLDALESDAPYTQPYGSVSISNIELDWSAYLGTPDTFTGWFECSDEDLTQWWFDGVYTTDMSSDTFLANETDPRDSATPTLEGTQVIFDGAKRDRDPYVGDLAVASLTSYLSHDAPEMTRNILVDLANHQRADGWIPPASINNYTLPLYDYPMWWVVATYDFVMYTGDTDFVAQYYDVMKKTLDSYYGQNLTSTHGLLNKTNGYGDYAFLPRSGVITYYNALYVHALKSAAQLANILGHDADSNAWTTRASEIGTKMLARNWDYAVGAFFDGGPCPDKSGDTICNVHAQDGNGLAVLSGAVNTSVATSLLDFYGNTAARTYGNAFYDNDSIQAGFSQRVYAFISYFELAARFATLGASNSAFDEIKRLYGWMSTHDPEITFWEGIGPDGAPYEDGFTSMAHGWSTGIVPLMSNYVLGIKPTAPGFKTWQVCPVIDGGNLTWARGAVGTPSGPIKVRWEKGTDGSFALQIDTPKNTNGVICVPTGGSKGRVVMDGMEVDGNADVDIIGPIATAGEGFRMVRASGGVHMATVNVGK
ncbi:hypothetical protein N7499_011949 [Penicillium canescens]|uniref:Alpha-L-rhamnosidase n=1 Tax=Penicillium canescens TaxID=5083 RepID=A0AAD6IMK5_PENCN|nr:uncharacterized protein N7446_007220 [Penicillium canescens]KAJ5991291.1 hypothetical protein N7522_011498 [Penicillium canescens]KAJ6049449.1 hypothetical protein N7444_006165 [Penicillium canescens]KAJ6052580.1 hypothetical protein N7460_003114 [Penicillium canescens]KAJ6063100.1 hypothetical protein N7446_007220 [Penicillium canescens]KAJ6070062.1 hypothetical protein N7499_011949 [Penicillium canescens]